MPDPSWRDHVLAEHGAEAKAHLDSLGPDDPQTTTPPKEPPMAGDPTRMSAADIEAARQLAASFPAISDEGELRARAARLASAVRRMTPELERLTKERDALKTAAKKTREAAQRLQEAATPSVAAFWSNELLNAALALDHTTEGALDA